MKKDKGGERDFVTVFLLWVELYYWFDEALYSQLNVVSTKARSATFIVTFILNGSIPFHPIWIHIRMCSPLQYMVLSQVWKWRSLSQFGTFTWWGGTHGEDGFPALSLSPYCWRVKVVCTTLKPLIMALCIHFYVIIHFSFAVCFCSLVRINTALISVVF